MATNFNISQIPAPRVPLIDERTQLVSQSWFRWFNNIYAITGSGAGITPIINGGTGTNATPAAGQLLIGTGTAYDVNNLTPSTGIGITNGVGTITIANTGVLSNIAGAGISVSGATGNVTIANTGVLSFSGGTTGLTPAAPTTGAVVLAGTLNLANGGSGATTAAGARTNFGATTLGSNLFTITNPSAITFPRFNADNTVSSLNASDFRTAIGAGTGSGTVTSVGTTGSVNGITLTGTVTTAGTLTLGGTLSGVSLTTQVSGILPIANGGTGTSSAGVSATIVTAKLTALGSNGSMTFVNGLLTSQTPAT